MPGYSGTPLIKKLGFHQSPLKVITYSAPKEYLSWLGDLPEGVSLSSRTPTKNVQAAHVFAKKRSVLEKRIVMLRERLEQDGMVWISWPKKASKVETDITEDTIREIALPIGFVDIKVCAVSEVWSGLKLVIRKSERK